ncbi:MAG: ABC transporter ATP-binding protein [Anaerolineae bacterium]
MTLNIESIGKQYKRGVWSPQDFTLSLEPGVVGLLGPNGAGKSTLMNIIATLIKPTEGRVVWNGSEDPNAIRRDLGYLPQHFGVYPNLNAVEFLQYMAALKGISPKAAKRRIDELLHLVNLEEAARRPIGSYSGGMRQRVGIAQALLNDPKLLIVDEPTVGLDPAERVRFRNLIADLASDRIIILSTHIVSDVEATATTIALINKGRLLRYDTPDAILATMQGRVWDLTVSRDALPHFKENYLVSHINQRPDGVQLRIVHNEAPASTATIAHPNLEDAFLGYTS